MSKISELSDGGSLQSTDYLIAVRSGGNVKVRPNGAVSGTTGQFSTSLNVDGTVTADGLTVANTAVVAGDFDGGTAATYIRLQDDTDNFLFGSNNSLGNFLIKNETADALRLSVANNGDISFYEDTGTTPKFFWDASAERLGLGTTSPSYKLDLKTTGSPSVRVRSDDAGGTATLLLESANTFSGTSQAYIKGIGTVGSGLSQLSFGTAGSSGDTSATERMRIDSAGNVGIGVASPGGKLSVRGTSGLGISDSHIAFGANQDAYITTGASGIVVFREHDGVSTNTERMRIDSSGNLKLGTTSITTDPGIQLFGSGGIYTHISGTSSSDSMRFYRNNAQVGSIVTTGTTTTYNTSSDARLKENIADAESASELIDAIQVRQFHWKADGSHQRYGMVAQELLEVAPEAVSQPEDPDDMMGVDYSKLVPMLVKEIQSLRARVAQLEGA